MIESTVAYLLKEHNWLMLLRNKKVNDLNSGKWIGVGGKIEAGETPAECIQREIREETGLECIPEFRGTILFNYDSDETEKIYVYTSEKFTGNLRECEEGTLEWIHETEILKLQLWEGDRIFLKKLLRNEQQTFSLIFNYNDNGELTQVKEVL